MEVWKWWALGPLFEPHLLQALLASSKCKGSFTRSSTFASSQNQTPEISFVLLLCKRKQSRKRKKNVDNSRDANVDRVEGHFRTHPQTTHLRRCSDARDINYINKNSYILFHAFPKKHHYTTICRNASASLCFPTNFREFSISIFDSSWSFPEIRIYQKNWLTGLHFRKDASGDLIHPTWSIL